MVNREREMSSTGLSGVGMDWLGDGRILIFPTGSGIQVVDTETHQVLRTLGGRDAGNVRFLGVCAAGDDGKVDKQLALARGKGSGEAVDRTKEGEEGKRDPMLVALGWGAKRFYVFSKYGKDDEEGGEEGERDVLNEPPDREDLLLGNQGRGEDPKLGKEAIIRTTMGDIHLKLFGDQCPRTVENFSGHGRSGYYEGTVMHRVIKGFMLQMGDPKGDGTGGESIWGGEFEDEIVQGLRHDRAFTVSMANAGPGTNGSQFFVTTVPTPWLDGKHTVFGRVTRGMDVCTAIEGTATDHADRPVTDIKILKVDIMN